MTALQSHPRWIPDGTEDAGSPRFATLLASLKVTTQALLAVAKNAPDSPSEWLEICNLFGRGMDLVRTLRTICRCQQSLNAMGTGVQAASSNIGSYSLQLQQAIAPIALRLLAVEETDLAHCSDGAALRAWQRAFQGCNFLSPWLSESIRPFDRALRLQVIAPLASLYTHLTGTMSLRVRGDQSIEHLQGFSMSLQVLRNSDDRGLRRSTFEKMTSWLAAHSHCLADVLNGMTGYWAFLCRDCNHQVLDIALKSQRTSAACYQAMFNAIEEKLPQIREAVTLRQEYFGQGPMKPWDVLSLMPCSDRIGIRSIGQTIQDLREAFEDVDPAFLYFVDQVQNNHWMDIQLQSAKGPGSWCDDLPALDSIRIFSQYLPTLSGEGALAHIFGAGYLMQILHQSSAAERMVPLSFIEIAARYTETMLITSLTRKAESREERYALLWLSLRRITNNLLVIPSRHRLLCQIFVLRRKGLLEPATLTELSREAGEHYFGSSLSEADRYVWAYKPHFYRFQPIFYDWQYTMGYLISQKLLDQFHHHGCSCAGFTPKQMWQELGSMTLVEFGKKHLGADLEQLSFWRQTIRSALKPIAEVKALGGFQCPTS